MIDRQTLRRFIQGVFWLALGFTLYEALVPAKTAVALFPWDKAEHFTAFYVLTGLAAAAFPQHKILFLAAALSGFGALIELVQALPMMHRDGDVQDWLADTLAVGAALAPMALLPWRRRFWPTVPEEIT